MSQKELADLSDISRRWLKALMATPENEIIIKYLKEMFFANEAYKRGFFENLKDHIESVIKDKAVLFVQENFSLAEQELINKNAGRFTKALELICLYNIEGKENLKLKNLENLKGQLAWDEGSVKEYKLRPKYREALNAAHLLVQKVGDLKQEQIMGLDSFLNFKRSYDGLKPNERESIREELRLRSNRAKDPYRSGCGKLYRLL